VLIPTVHRFSTLTRMKETAS